MRVDERIRIAASDLQRRLGSVDVPAPPTTAPRQAPGWLRALVAAVLVVAGFGFLAPPAGDIDNQPGDVVGPPDASPSTVTTIAPTTTLPTTTVPSTTVTSLAPVVPAEGPLFGVETGVLILVDDGLSGIVAIDPDKRLAARSAVEGQRPGDEPYSMVRVGDSLVVGWSEIFAADIETRASTSLGFATIFVPAAEQDRVWLIDWPGGAIGSGTPEVWQVSLAGEQLTEPVELDALGFPAFGIPGGLVLQAAQGLVLWEAATGETEFLTARGRGFVFDVRGDELAWCDSPCTELHVTDLATSVTESHPAPAGSTGFRAGSGSFGASSTFSPDGLWLAAIVENSDGDETNLWVLNRQSGEVLVHGDALRVDYLAWAPDSQQLFATSYSYGQSRTVVWRYDVAANELQAAILPFGGGLASTVIDSVFAERYLGDVCPALGSFGETCSFGF
jgi:hypothetical protein